LLSLFVIRNFRGTCSSVEMLKEYMVRERLVTPELDLCVVQLELPKYLMSPAANFQNMFKLKAVLF